MSNTKPKPDISTTVKRVGVDVPGSLFRAPARHEWLVLDSTELLWSLRNIRDKAVEEHTRKNLQTLIEQIRDMKPSV